MAWPRRRMPRRCSCGRGPGRPACCVWRARAARRLLAAGARRAAGAAVLGLYQAGRRRSYEYAALIAGRVPRRSLRASVFIEQSVILGFGVLMGVAGGIGLGALVLRNLPVFLTPPAAPLLLHVPSATQGVG